MFGFEYYIYWIPLLLFLYILWNYNVLQSLGQTLKTLYTTHQLLVKTSGTGIFGHTYGFIKRYSYYRWVFFRDSVMGNVTVHADGTTEVTYAANGRIFTYIVKPKRGPSPILAAFDDKSDLKTDYIMSLHGPNRDWHGREYTPKNLGCKTITLELSNGMSLNFNDSESICIE